MLKQHFRALLLACAIAAPAFGQAKIEPPVPLRTPQPVYPVELKRDGIVGVAVMKFTVDVNGNVTNAMVEKSTNAAFDKPALDAINKWKFRPATQDGAPIARAVSITLKFTIQN